jgi:anti-sigma factor RsiW
MKANVAVCALLAASTAPWGAAHALDCGTGILTSVSGNVSTLNVSPTQQAGKICLTLTDQSGRERFDSCGALLGQITASDAATGQSTLTHTALFKLPDLFQTGNDTAQITDVLATDESGQPCAFSVVEHITEIAQGQGIFRGGKIDAYATGTLSFCPGSNLNTFSLSGQACLRRR